MSFGRRQRSPDLSGHGAGFAPARVTARAPMRQPELASGPAENLHHSANAVIDIVAMLMSAYTRHGHLHAESAIAAAAALTGEFAQRPADGSPSGQDTSGAVNDLLFAGAPDGRPTCWMFMMHAAIEAGVAAYDLPDIEHLGAGIAVANDAGSFPPLSIPEKHIPLEPPCNAGPRFRYRIIAIADTHDLSLREVTIALAAATGQLILRTRHEVPPLIAVTLAAETMLAAARTPPLAEVVAA